MTTHPCTLEDLRTLFLRSGMYAEADRVIRLIAERDEECRTSGSSQSSHLSSGSSPASSSSSVGLTNAAHASDPPPDVWRMLRNCVPSNSAMWVPPSGVRDLLTAHDADVAALVSMVSFFDKLRQAHAKELHKIDAECTRLRAEVERLGKMGWHCRWCRDVFADEDAIDAHGRTCASSPMVKEIADKKAQIEERDASLHLIRIRLADQTDRADANWKGFEKREEECATLRSALSDERKHSNSARMFVAHGAIHGFCGANAPQYNYALQWVNDHDALRAKEKNDGQ